MHHLAILCHKINNLLQSEERRNEESTILLQQNATQVLQIKRGILQKIVHRVNSYKNKYVFDHLGALIVPFF